MLLVGRLLVRASVHASVQQHVLVPTHTKNADGTWLKNPDCPSSKVWSVCKAKRNPHHNMISRDLTDDGLFVVADENGRACAAELPRCSGPCAGPLSLPPRQIRQFSVRVFRTEGEADEVVLEEVEVAEVVAVAEGTDVAEGCATITQTARDQTAGTTTQAR